MDKSYLDLVKEPVRKSHVYMLPQIDYDVKANQNENPWDIPQEIKQEILQALKSQLWNRYPTLTSPVIREKIAHIHSLKYEQVAVGNGSNELMLAIIQALLSPGKTLLTVEPTFSLYSHYAKVLGAKVKSLPLGEQFSFPVKTLTEKSIESSASLVVLCSPNNPTGNTIAQDDLVQILHAANGYVLVDEAYVDFTNQKFIPLLEQYSNLIITRTFSKAYAFGFGRFGYALGAADIITEIYKVLLPYNLNGFTELAAGILLENREILQQRIDEIKSSRMWLYKKLEKIKGLQVYPSEANFLLVQLERSVDEIFNLLLQQNILVRNVSHYPGLANHIRISVGTQEENKKIVETLRSFLE